MGDAGAEQTVTSFAPDQAVAEWFRAQALEHPLLADAGQVLAVALHPWVFRALVVVAGVLAWRGGHRRAAMLAVTTMAVGGVLGGVLKLLIQRPRPAWADPVAAEGGFSMPSGHALNAALGCSLLVVLAWPWLRARGRAGAVTTAVLVVTVTGLDRTVLGVHYLSDVVVGASLGTGLALVAAVLTRRGGLARRGFPPTGAEARHGGHPALG